eukprot:TRINITY_DN7813_c0_g1_i1.p1 TRINITY_DN7813_c0_g1~~TRINITY_DN7813_c0_g1_i1.p1  ORF type:complete len:218 (+),score=27.15 TRINITY_DN7813_c0_g1_i1:51-704(+)
MNNETQKLPYRCIHCLTPTKNLFTTIDSTDVLSKCPKCHHYSDEYFDKEPLICFIDCVLMEPTCIRHMVFNSKFSKEHAVLSLFILILCDLMFFLPFKTTSSYQCVLKFLFIIIMFESLFIYLIKLFCKAKNNVLSNLSVNISLIISLLMASNIHSCVGLIGFLYPTYSNYFLIGLVVLQMFSFFSSANKTLECSIPFSLLLSVINVSWKCFFVLHK